MLHFPSSSNIISSNISSVFSEYSTHVHCSWLINIQNMLIYWILCICICFCIRLVDCPTFSAQKFNQTNFEKLYLSQNVFKAYLIKFSSWERWAIGNCVLYTYVEQWKNYFVFKLSSIYLFNFLIKKLKKCQWYIIMAEYKNLSCSCFYYIFFLRWK